MPDLLQCLMLNKIKRRGLFSSLRRKQGIENMCLDMFTHKSRWTAFYACKILLRNACSAGHWKSAVAVRALFLNKSLCCQKLSTAPHPLGSFMKRQTTSLSFYLPVLCCKLSSFLKTLCFSKRKFKDESTPHLPPRIMNHSCCHPKRP